jgi:hypothetical protein
VKQICEILTSKLDPLADKIEALGLPAEFEDTDDIRQKFLKIPAPDLAPLSQKLACEMEVASSCAKSAGIAVNLDRFNAAKGMGARAMSCFTILTILQTRGMQNLTADTSKEAGYYIFILYIYIEK